MEGLRKQELERKAKEKEDMLAQELIKKIQRDEQEANQRKQEAKKEKEIDDKLKAEEMKRNIQQQRDAIFN